MNEQIGPSSVKVEFYEHRSKQVFKEPWFINKDCLIYTIPWLDEILKFQEVTQFWKKVVYTQHQAIQMRIWANHSGMWSLLTQTFQVVVGNTFCGFDTILLLLNKLQYNEATLELAAPNDHRLPSQKAKLDRILFKGWLRPWKWPTNRNKCKCKAFMKSIFKLSKKRKACKQIKLNFPCNRCVFVRLALP